MGAQFVLPILITGTWYVRGRWVATLDISWSCKSLRSVLERVQPPVAAGNSRSSILPFQPKQRLVHGVRHLGNLLFQMEDVCLYDLSLLLHLQHNIFKLSISMKKRFKVISGIVEVKRSK